MPAHRCYFCGHIGTDVNHIYHTHVGGPGEVEYSICDDKLACIERVESKDYPGGVRFVVSQ